MAFCNTEYFDQIGNIQKSMHERERRRHELEEILLDYLRSEERLTKLKCAKMRCYYKELREREQQAKTRNLELLGNVENLASKMKEFSIDCSRLLQKRLEYNNHITRLKKDRKKMGSRGESEADELPSRFQLPSIQGSSQSAVIFTGHHTSNGSSRNDGVTTTRSPSQTELIPNHPSLSPLQSGLCMHSHVLKASGIVILSDDILNSGDFLEERHLSDVREKQMESDWDVSQRAGERHRCEELNSPHTTLKEAEVSSLSVTAKKPADIVSLERYLNRSPSPDATDPRDSSQYMNSGGEDEEGDSTPRHQDLSDDTNSRHHALRGDVVIQEQSVIPFQTKGGTHKQVNTQESGRLHSLESPNRLSMEGFCHLLDSIERRLSAKDVKLYRSTVNEQKLDDIISICGQCGRLDGVELHSCGAVVLQQLPLLSCSLSHGCLLPSDLINTHWSSATKPEQIRSCLSAESALLWDCCFRHFFQLQQQKILSTDHIIQLFTPLLVPYNATYTEKAGELLKRLLTHKSETHQPSESELSSSCSLPSLLDDSVEIKPARPSKTNKQTVGTQGIQSAEEDSADQSPVESIPIRETKAYQLLKQSVAQERHWSDSEEQNSEPSDINTLERSEVLRDSLTQNNRKTAKSKAFSAVQSKAFWGESDDSNSEIEMALRPQSRNTSSHDFDDFYD
ncbi:centrosomal protein kizuna isoform X2 [Sinocyclocheilus anshuiensis]|uniref:centrosomal protein kizuna isoform X2 n=1 Tax=Sinocyclocheilus anshuiensis TaxID=1608454 RepID=UPI0007B8F41B|nr:PREDICTED: centrosomal protein kizuna isoform X2 [Sinocyclocheilus anshuiensis]